MTIFIFYGLESFIIDNCRNRKDIPNLRNGTEPFRNLFIPKLWNGTDRILLTDSPFKYQERL